MAWRTGNVANAWSFTRHRSRRSFLFPMENRSVDKGVGALQAQISTFPELDMMPETYLERLLKCIDQIYKNLSEANDYTHQSAQDILSGFFRKHCSNVLVPLESQIHRIQLESHELFVLNGYLILAKTLLKEAENPLAYFTLRILHEIGIKKIDALFAEEVPEKNREEFKRLDSLSDLLGFFGDPKYRAWFLELMKDERNNLSFESKEILEKAETTLMSGKEIELSLLKKIRRLVNKKLGDCIHTVKLPEILERKTDFGFLNIAMSHLLHGNPISIKTALTPAFAVNSKNHVQVMIWNTGLNVLVRTKRFIQNKDTQKEIDALISEAEIIWGEFQKRRRKV